jgi:hypothetical protein
VAYGKKTGGRNFKPGNKFGVPRKAMPQEWKDAMKEIREGQKNATWKYARAYARMQDMTASELRKFVGTKDKPGEDAPIVELIAARGILKVLASPAIKEIAALRELMCGPEPKRVEVSGPGGEPLLNPLAAMPPAELVAAYHAVLKTIQEPECNSMQKQQQPSEPLAPSSPGSSDTES